MTEVAQFIKLKKIPIPKKVGITDDCASPRTPRRKLFGRMDIEDELTPRSRKRIEMMKLNNDLTPRTPRNSSDFK